MVAKKSSKANLENKKSVFTLIGFVVGLSLVFIALEWSKSDFEPYVNNNPEVYIPNDLDIPQTSEKRKLPPPPPPPPVVVEQIKIVDNLDPTKTPDISSEETNKPLIFGVPVRMKAEEEAVDSTFIVVEQMPEFKGNIFKYLSENIHYPQDAIEYNIQGKVYCEFVVNRDGSIVDVKVVRGVDRSLDKEAVRVIESMPKWNPGKQRGKAVRVKYTLPISFKLMM